MTIDTLITGYDGIKIRIKNCDLRLMTEEESKWFVRKYKHICQIEDVINRWYEQKQSQLNISVYERILFKYRKQNEIVSTQYIKNECNEINSELILAPNTENKIKLGKDTVLELKQDNVDKIKDLIIEKEREECELIMEKMLDEFRCLKENYEHRRIEVQENIKKFGQISAIIEMIESSMNFEAVQGYVKKEGKEKEINEELQEVVRKGGADTAEICLISNSDSSSKVLYYASESNNGLIMLMNKQNNYLNEVIYILDSNGVSNGVNAYKQSRVSMIFHEFNEIQDQRFTNIGTINPTSSQTSNLISNLFRFFIIDDGG